MDVMAVSDYQRCLHEERVGDEIAYSVHCPSLASWLDMRTKLNIVQSSCSPLFIESHADAMKLIEARLKEQCDALQAACQRALAAKATATARKVTACVQQLEESTDEALLQGAFGSLTCLTGKAISPLTELCSKEELATYTDMQTSVAQHSAVLVVGAGWLLGLFKAESCDVTSDNAKSFLSSLVEIAKHIPEHSEFHACVKLVNGKLAEVVRRQLTESVSRTSPFYLALGQEVAADQIIELAKTSSKRLKNHRSVVRF